MSADSDKSITLPGGLRLPRSELSFRYSRSGGPGGQNVNKVNTKAELRWAVHESTALPEAVRRRFIESYGSRITQDGELVLASDTHRSQLRNAEQCVERLVEMIAAVVPPPKRRKKTKPSRRQKQKRLDAKKKQSEKKKGRGKIDF